MAVPKILSVLKRLQRWFQNKSGIGENRDALDVLRRRVDALAAVQQQHLPETLNLPWLPDGLGSVSTAIHRADAMFRYPLSASGGTWVRATTEYFATGRELAQVAKLASPAAASVLDFGGGYGRVGRFLALEFAHAQRWVYDPKAAAMAFQQTQWGAQPWDGQPADLIVAGSVFTHLHIDVARAELHRLCGQLTPDGVLLVTLHDFVPQTRTYAATEESALPELEDQLKPESYASVYFSQGDWAQLIPQGYRGTLRPERFGGTQQIIQIQRAESEA